MIWTQSQAIIVATVSCVFVLKSKRFVHYQTALIELLYVCRIFTGFCSHLASEQVDGVWLRVPNDGRSGATPARCRTLRVDRARASVVESPRCFKTDVPLQRRARTLERDAGGKGASVPATTAGRAPASQNPQRGHLCSWFSTSTHSRVESCGIDLVFGAAWV